MATAARNRYASPRPRARNDAYVGLLTISLLALVTSCVLLYLDYSDYGAQKPPYTPNVSKSVGNVTLPSDAARPADTGPAGSPMEGAAPMEGSAPMGGADEPDGRRADGWIGADGSRSDGSRSDGTGSDGSSRPNGTGGNWAWGHWARDGWPDGTNGRREIGASDADGPWGRHPEMT